MFEGYLILTQTHQTLEGKIVSMEDYHRVNQGLGTVPRHLNLIANLVVDGTANMLEELFCPGDWFVREAEQFLLSGWTLMQLDAVGTLEKAMMPLDFDLYNHDYDICSIIHL